MKTIEKYQSLIGAVVKMSGHLKGAQIVAISYKKKNCDVAYIGINKRSGGGHNGAYIKCDIDYDVLGDLCENMWWHPVTILNKNIVIKDTEHEKLKSSANLFSIDDL